MGGCATKPKVLKEDDEVAPRPTPPPSKEELACTVPKADEILVVGKDKDIVDEYGDNEPGIKRRRSLSSFFQESEEGKDSTENDKKPSKPLKQRQFEPKTTNAEEDKPDDIHGLDLTKGVKKVGEDKPDTKTQKLETKIEEKLTTKIQKQELPIEKKLDSIENQAPKEEEKKPSIENQKLESPMEKKVEDIKPIVEIKKIETETLVEKKIKDKATTNIESLKIDKENKTEDKPDTVIQNPTA